MRLRRRKVYHYMITLKKPIWPRKLADALMNGEFSGLLVSVTDWQNDNHMYGDTYVISRNNTKPRKRRASLSA
jgi:hypothetical protein